MYDKHAIGRFSARTGAAVIALALSFGSVPAVSSAATSTELQAQLDRALAESESYRQNTEKAFQQLENLQGKLEDTKASIATVKKEIKEKKAELGSAQAELADQTSSVYKSGGISLLSTVLGSSTFSDLTSRVFYANKVAESYSSTIDSVKTLQTELDQKETKLTKEQSEQEKLVSSAQATADKVQAAQREHDDYVNGLSADVQKAVAKEEAARRAEEEKRAAEEAARREQNQGSDAAEDTSGNRDQGSDSPSGSDNSHHSNSSSNSSSGNSSNSNGGNSGSHRPSSGSNSNSSSNSGSHGGGSSSNSGGSVNVGAGVSGAIAAAKTQLGVSYSWAGRAIAGQEFDCSGLVWWSYKQAGISIPRGQRMSNGRNNSMIGRALDGGSWTTNQANLKPGDLMFWGSSVNNTTHVGMCIGGGMMIHSNYSGVEITSIYYSNGTFVGGGSVV